jgi:hypothetical protein
VNEQLTKSRERLEKKAAKRKPAEVVTPAEDADTTG